MTLIICSECGAGRLHAQSAYVARCTDCSKVVDVSHDVKAYLDADETLTVDAAHMLVVVSS